MKNPLVSVGIPVCNGGGYLKESLQLILDQTYKNLEVIISDDQSEDDSYKLLKRFAKKDKRIKLIQQKKRTGSVNNFNFCLQKATGEYFFWAAQDDVHDKRFVEYLIKVLLQDEGVALAMCDYRNLHDNKKHKIYDTPADSITSITDSLRYLLDMHNLSLFYGLHRTAILKKIGGYHADARPYFRSSDFLMIYKTLLLGKLGFVRKILFYKRDTGLYTNEFDNLKRLPIQNLTKRIVRYALFPIHYIFDLMYGTMYLLRSDLQLNQKFQIEIWLLICTIRLFGTYIIKSLRGILIVLKRILKL